MNINSFTETLKFDDEKVNVKLIHESPFTKEIRILLKKGQLMKDHKAPSPIVIHIIEGKITFGFNGEELNLKTGDIISLQANIVHNLVAINNSVIRLTLSKVDNIKRVEKVVS